MRDKYKKLIFSAFCVFFPLSLQLAAQDAETQAAGPVPGKYSDIGDALKSFANINAKRMAVTGEIGLAWSDAYLGPLINLPPHWGIGISLGANAINSGDFNDLTKMLSLDDINGNLGIPFLPDAHLFPAYAVELRIGGFRSEHFDIGVRFGYLPAALSFFGDYKYTNMNVGGDIRFNINRGYGWSPKMSLSLGFSYVTGSYAIAGYQGTWSDTGKEEDWTPDTVFVSNGSNLEINWKSLAVQVQYSVSKTFQSSGISIYGGLAIGFAPISNTGMAISGADWTYGGRPAMENYETIVDDVKELAGFDDLSLTGDFTGIGFSGTMDPDGVSAVLLTGSAGLSFDFTNKTHLQLGLLFDFFSQGYGLTIGYRWQQ